MATVKKHAPDAVFNAYAAGDTASSGCLWSAPVPELDGVLGYALVRTPDLLDPDLPDVWSVAVFVASRSGFTDAALAFDVARSESSARAVASALCSARATPDSLLKILDPILAAIV